jgi:hypothetical protein
LSTSKNVKCSGDAPLDGGRRFREALLSLIVSGGATLIPSFELDLVGYGK